MDGERRPVGMRSLKHSVVVGTAALCALVLFVVADHPKKSGEIALFASSSWSSRGGGVVARRTVEEDVRRLEKDLALLHTPHGRQEQGRDDRGDELARTETKARQARLSDDVEQKESEDGQLPFHKMFEESQRHHESALHRLDEATRHLLDKWLRVDAARKERGEDGEGAHERTSRRGVAEFDIKLGGIEGRRGARDERREARHAVQDDVRTHGRGGRGGDNVERKEEDALSLLDQEYEAKKKALMRLMHKHDAESGAGERREETGSGVERRRESRTDSGDGRGEEEAVGDGGREREREGKGEEERRDRAVGEQSKRYYSSSVNQQLAAYPYSQSLAEAQVALSPGSGSGHQLDSASAGPAASESLALAPARGPQASTQALTWPPPSPSTVPRGAYKDTTIYDSDYNWPSELQVATGDEWREKGDCGMFGGNC